MARLHQGPTATAMPPSPIATSASAVRPSIETTSILTNLLDKRTLVLAAKGLVVADGTVTPVTLTRNGLFGEVRSVSEFGHLPDQLQSGIRNEKRAFRKALVHTVLKAR